MKHFYYILIIFIGILLSCKDKENIETNDNIVHYAKVGITDSLMNYRLLKIDFENKMEHVFGFELLGKDSIDLDFDQEYDLIFTVSDVDQYLIDSICSTVAEPADCYPTTIYPFFSINISNNLQIIADTIEYRYQPEYYKTYVDTLSYGDTLNLLERWRSERPMLLYDLNSWDYIQNKNQNGKWLNENRDKYLGFRKYKDNKYIYGWIRITCYGRDIIIQDMAIDK